MTSPRRHSREIALKALYQAEVNNSNNYESLEQILAESIFAPAVETVVKDFLKVTKAQEILSGKVEEFIPDFVDSISVHVHDEQVAFVALIKKLLETYFPGVTINESFVPEFKSLVSGLEEKFSKAFVVEEFAKQLIEKITAHKADIEKSIANTAKNWSLERMATVDRCILKIAVCEFFYFENIPVKATINEAIELAKKYSTDRSYEFVNGILDKINKENKFVKTDNSSANNAN